MRLAHLVQHRVAAMLRRRFELTADMILNQLIEKRFVFILHQIIIPDTGTDEYALDPFYRTKLAQ